MASVLGRAVQLSAIGQFLDDLPRGSAILTLEGEAGIGKTTLWKEAITGAAARHYQILSAQPNEAEKDMAFIVLGDLFRDVGDETWSSISGAPVSALKGALLQAEASSDLGTPRAVGIGVLAVIQELSRSGVVLIAIDDVHWCDAASRSALQFALRRLGDEPVGVVVSLRSPETDRRSVVAREERTRSIQVGPLTLESLDQLLRARLAAAFSRTTLTELHSVSGGNPFFALEIGRYILSEGVESGRGGRLPLPTNLTELVLRRIKRAPSSTRGLLLSMATMPQPTESLLVRLFKTRAEFDAVMQPALDMQLVDIRDTSCQFEHPLIGSVIYAAATPEQRRQAHRGISGLQADPDERARHLGFAAEHADEELAQQLEDAGSRADARGAPDAAASFLERAATLTPTEQYESATRRTIREADYRLRAGDTDRARTLLETIVRTMPPGTLRAQALHRLGNALASGAGMQHAEGVFKQALGEASGDAQLRAAVERDLVVSLLQNGRPQAARTHVRALSRLAHGSQDDSLLATAMAHDASVNFLIGRGVPAKTIDQIQSLVSTVTSSPEQVPYGLLDPLLMCGAMLKWSDAFDEARIPLELDLSRISQRHDEGVLAPVLFQLGELECWAGNLQLAAEYAERCDAVTRMGAQHARRHLAFTLRALVGARQGRLEEARQNAADALSGADASGDVQFAMRALAVIGNVELMTANFPAARDALNRVHFLFDGGGYGEPGVFRFHADEVEAWIALGQLEEARRQIDWLELRGRSLNRPWARATGARCRGLVLAAAGDLSGGLNAIEEALAHHSRLGDPIERGRTYLAHGTVLRRAKQKGSARDSLQVALDIFESVNALAWADKVRSDMNRLGKRPSRPDELTSTELRIAQLAASGSSNADVARTMFLSVKSVEACLTRIYQKMQVRSRTAMAAKLVEEDQV